MPFDYAMTGSLFGIIVGYFLRYGHEWVLDAMTPGTSVRPSSVPVEPRSLPPGTPEPPPAPTEPQSLIGHPELIITKRCPEGFTAASVLGHNYFGTIHPPQYPGGIDTWTETHHGSHT